MAELRRRQDQAFDMAAEMALALEPDEPVPSRFTAWNRLTAWRAAGSPLGTDLGCSAPAWPRPGSGA